MMSSTLKRAILEAALYSLGAFLGLRYLVMPLLMRLRYSHLDTRKKKSAVVESIARQKGVKELALSEHEQVIAQCLVNVQDLHVDFGSVGGYEKVKRAITEAIIYPFKYPLLYNDPRVRVCECV